MARGAIHIRRWTTLLISVMILQGCSDSRPSRVLDPDSPVELALHFEDAGGNTVSRFGFTERITFVLEVTNLSDEPVDLRFRTRQVFDFVVESNNGSRIWVWSDGKVFLDAITTLIIDPGVTESVRVEWDQRRFDGNLAGTGRFRSRGLLPVETGALESRAETFRIE